MLSVSCSVCSCLFTWLWCRSSLFSRIVVTSCTASSLYGIGVLFHLILLLKLLMCRLILCFTVYPVWFWFYCWWRVRVFYASVVLMTWHVHVTGCMIHKVLCVIAQYDICCVLDQCGRCRCAGCCDSCVRYVLLVTRHRPSVPTLEARRIEMTDVSTSIACGCLSFI